MDGVTTWKNFQRALAFLGRQAYDGIKFNFFNPHRNEKPHSTRGDFLWGFWRFLLKKRRKMMGRRKNLVLNYDTRMNVRMQKDLRRSLQEYAPNGCVSTLLRQLGQEYIAQKSREGQISENEGGAAA